MLLVVWRLTSSQQILFVWGYCCTKGYAYYHDTPHRYAHWKTQVIRQSSRRPLLGTVEAWGPKGWYLAMHGQDTSMGYSGHGCGQAFGRWHASPWWEMTVSLFQDAGITRTNGVREPVLTELTYTTQHGVPDRIHRTAVQSCRTGKFMRIYIRCIHPLEAWMPRHPDPSHSRLKQQLTWIA